MSKRLLVLVGAVAGGLLAADMLARADLGTSSGVVIPFSGRLERNGAPVTGNTPMRFRVWSARTGGTQCPGNLDVTAPVLAGEFSVVIGPVTESCVLGRDVWLEVMVMNGAQEVPLADANNPRQRVFPVVGAMTSGTGNFRVSGSLHSVGTISTDTNVTAVDVTASRNVSVSQDLSVTRNLRVSGNVVANEVFLNDLSNNQGAHIYWNRIGGSGETNFVNHRGGGPGGFTFEETTNGSTFTRTMTISSAGTVTAPGGFSGNLTGNVTGNVTGLINTVNVRIKTGNNGTVSCDGYCLNSTFEGFAGSCLGARLNNGQYTADCGYIPGGGGANPLRCLCATY